MVRNHGKKGEARKQRIIQATLDMVVEYGVPGTTMARVADAAGVTKASLYEYFSSRRDMLLAGLDAVFDSIFAIHRFASHPDALERLREIGRRHTYLIYHEERPYEYALVEFMAAPPEEGLRHAVGEKQMTAAVDLAAIVEEGKRQGSILIDVDSLQVGWMIAGWAWTESISHLIGAAEFWNADRSTHMLDVLLQGIRTGEEGTCR
ncbi:MAG: TetR/AcrR family transcriptional regulator [Actinobacteria bacterium]|nr:TetR/AcrR family transcriptional regulator [Actinomycetota bacterium]